MSHHGHTVLVGEDGQTRNQENWYPEVEGNKQREERRAQPLPAEADVSGQEVAAGPEGQAGGVEDS